MVMGLGWGLWKHGNWIVKVTSLPLSHQCDRQQRPAVSGRGKAEIWIYRHRSALRPFWAPILLSWAPIFLFLVIVLLFWVPILKKCDFDPQAHSFPHKTSSPGGSLLNVILVDVAVSFFQCQGSLYHTSSSLASPTF